MQTVSYDQLRGRGVWLGATAALAVAVAASWILAVFLINGKRLLNEVKLKLQQASTVQVQTVTGVLRRSAALSEHIDVLAIYGTPEFFAALGPRGRDLAFSPERSLVFILNEDTHVDALSRDPTPATLRIDGGETYHPEKAETFSYSQHHKVSVLIFSKKDSNGQPVLNERARAIELLVPKPGSPGSVVLRWDLPVVFPEQTLRGGNIPVGTMLALALGLLATVLTPCLIQLILYYLSTLTGMSAELPPILTAEASVRLLKVALSFVSGFTALFTGVGALAGWAGETLQGSALWETWTRPLAVSAGVVIVALGFWTAMRARAPLVCRLPIAKFAQAREAGFLRSSLMGLSFAVGCSTCFGGALIATLLFYVGTLGSAAQGALVLFLFSMGVAVPFLLAAVLLSRVLPLLNRAQKAAPFLGLASSLVMIAFGLLLITDNFHLVSGWIHDWIDSISG